MYSKNNPKNREHAFVLQLEDDLKLLNSLALVDSKESFKKQLSLLQARIDAYNNVELQEQCKNAEERAIKLNEIWSKMFGFLKENGK